MAWADSGLSRSLELVGNTLRYVRYIDDFRCFPVANIWTDTGVAGSPGTRSMSFETSPKSSSAAS